MEGWGSFSNLGFLPLTLRPLSKELGTPQPLGFTFYPSTLVPIDCRPTVSISSFIFIFRRSHPDLSPVYFVCHVRPGSHCLTWSEKLSTLVILPLPSLVSKEAPTGTEEEGVKRVSSPVASLSGLQGKRWCPLDGRDECETWDKESRRGLTLPRYSHIRTPTNPLTSHVCRGRRVHCGPFRRS